jgi:UDP-N-acetylglucosamine diphosphorylase / glucose-1-phosphate thymidylyltransferase / UDP-N-acetylgalactosamine diphosphorylase / glucosamine-1-phosphate N-acetyltransferase / galactosamine-1-phosphate N-acetyltransferase
MINIPSHTQQFKQFFPEMENETPWEVTQAAQLIIAKKIKTLSADYKVQDNVAIHKDAKVEEHVILKGPIIISAGCVISSHAYLRDGVFLGENVSVGPGCEIKSSFIFANTALAHFNFVADSIVGAHVNFEAGAVIVNCYNERKDKTVQVMVEGAWVSTEAEKFGALVGDHTKIGANAVLSPGTILSTKTIVKRLELIAQGQQD